MFGRRKDKGPTSKRLASNKKKRNGIFKRRKNQFPQTPDGMGAITTPNVHDIVHKPPEDEEDDDKVADEELTKEELYKTNTKRIKHFISESIQ